MIKHLFLFFLLVFLLACSSNSKQTQQNDSVKNHNSDTVKTVAAKGDSISEAVSQDLTTNQMNTNKTKNDKATTQCNNEGDTLTIKGVKTLCLAHTTRSLDKLKAALQKGDSLKMVCFGNSITNGYKVGSFGVVTNPYPYVLEKLLAKKYPNSGLKIVKEGHNGWRSDQAAKDVGTLVLAKKPDWVSLMFGINDAYAGWTPAFFGQKMESMIKKLKAQNIEVIIFTPTPFTTAYNEKAMAYLPVLKNLAAKYNCAFINLHKAVLQRAEKDNLDLDKVLPDEVHFGDEYYRLIAEEILKVFGE